MTLLPQPWEAVYDEVFEEWDVRDSTGQIVIGGFDSVDFAQLIAAAPDLLAACKLALYAVKDQPGCEALVFQLTDTIAKATGQQAERG
jgi:hypothetical protein